MRKPFASFIKNSLLFLLLLSAITLTGCQSDDPYTKREIVEWAEEIYGDEIELIDVDSHFDDNQKKVQTYTFTNKGITFEMESYLSPIYFDATIMSYEKVLEDRWFLGVANELEDEVREFDEEHDEIRIEKEETISPRFDYNIYYRDEDDMEMVADFFKDLYEPYTIEFPEEPIKNYRLGDDPWFSFREEGSDESTEFFSIRDLLNIKSTEEV